MTTPLTYKERLEENAADKHARQYSEMESLAYKVSLYSAALANKGTPAELKEEAADALQLMAESGLLMEMEKAALYARANFFLSHIKAGVSDGGTLDARDLRAYNTGGYVVAMERETWRAVSVEEIEARDLVELSEHAHEIGAKLVGFRVCDGVVHLDCVTDEMNREAALKLARRLAQVAVWDSANACEVLV